MLAPKCAHVATVTTPTITVPGMPSMAYCMCHVV